MCKCGCNTCETKGPLLTEGKVKSLLSEGLQYHIDKKIPLFETVYRIGSDKHLALIKEARKMYSRNVIDLCEDDEALIGTHLGEFALYEGVSVPLDLPMLNEGKAIITFKNDYEVKMNTGEGYDDDFEYFEAGEREQVYILDKNDKRTHVEFGDGTNAFIPSDVISVQEKSLEEAYSGFRRGEPEDPDSEPFNPTGAVAEFKEDLRALFGKFKGDLKNPEFIKGVAQIMVNWKSLLRSQLNESKIPTQDQVDKFFALTQNETHYLNSKPVAGQEKTFNKMEVEPWDEYDLSNWNSLVRKAKSKGQLNEGEIEEAEFKGKDVSLNKPKRGGSKAYYVYVRDPKTKKIKKVSFGSGGLRAKIKNKEARNAFAARHNCKNKKDRTKAGYWSCNLPRYAPALGLGAKMNTFW